MSDGRATVQNLYGTLYLCRRHVATAATAAAVAATAWEVQYLYSTSLYPCRRHIATGRAAAVQGLYMHFVSVLASRSLLTNRSIFTFVYLFIYLDAVCGRSDALI